MIQNIPSTRRVTLCEVSVGLATAPEICQWDVPWCLVSREKWTNATKKQPFKSPHADACTLMPISLSTTAAALSTSKGSGGQGLELVLPIGDHHSNDSSTRLLNRIISQRLTATFCIPPGVLKTHPTKGPDRENIKE